METSAALREDKWIHQLHFRRCDSRLCFHTLSHFEKESASVKDRSGVSPGPGTLLSMFSVCLWGLTCRMNHLHHMLPRELQLLQQLSFLEALDVAPPPWGSHQVSGKGSLVCQGVSKLSCIKTVYVGVPDWK